MSLDNCYNAILFLKELDELDAVVSRMVSKLQLEHGDIVTYKVRQ